MEKPNKVKDYLGYEFDRNKKNASMYVYMLKYCFGDHKPAVLIGHHITFEFDHDIETENEIPAADTLIFDHHIMGVLFGDDAYPIMGELALMPAEYRDAALRFALRNHGHRWEG